jgi:cobalt-zinc-cadmium efflux system membrane fusion protein
MINVTSRAILLVLLILAIGCGEGEPQAVKAVAERAAAPPPSTSEVILSPAAQQEAGIVAEEVQVRSLPQVIRATGRVTINENRTWRIGAVTDGRIVRVFANVGDKIEAGQILARMHSHEIHETRAAYQKAAAELARLKSVETYSQRVRDRARRLYELKAASLEQVEHAETELRNAQTAVANAQVELRRVEQHLVEFLNIPIQESGDETDEYDLIPIKSPASGTLLHRNVTAGTVVQPSSEVFVVTDLSTLWTIATVNEEYLPKLRTGMPVRVRVQAYPGRFFPGKIAKLGEELDPTTRTIMARVDVPNHDGLLKPEMYATAEIELGGSRPAIFVPEVTIQEVNGHNAVFVRKSKDRFEARPVETVPGVGGTLEVVSGLRAGDLVVAKGSFLLKSQLLKGSLAEE